MQIIVVGASGFLGAHTYQRLKSRGPGLVAGTYGRHAVYPELVAVDLASHRAVQALMQTYDPDTVIWCAKHRGPDDAESELNRIGLRTLLASAKAGMRLIYLSTDGLLPGLSGQYDERAETGPIASDSSIARYTNAKLEAEKFLMAEWDHYCIVRVGPIYGRSVNGEWDARVAGLAEALVRGETVQRATNIRRSFIHVEDLAEALLALVVNTYTGVLHLGPAVSASYFEFATQVAKRWGFDPHRGILPYEVSSEEARAREIRMDTSLDTRLATRVTGVHFRTVSEVLRVP